MIIYGNSNTASIAVGKVIIILLGLLHAAALKLNFMTASPRKIVKITTETRKGLLIKLVFISFLRIQLLI